MTTTNPFRDLPSVDALLGNERVRALSAEYSGDTVIALVREELDRRQFASGFSVVIKPLLVKAMVRFRSVW